MKYNRCSVMTRVLVMTALTAICSANAAAQYGSIVAWGNNYQGQCNVPPPNSEFVMVAGGSYHGLGLMVDGSIVAWGNNLAGQCYVPAPNTDFVVIDAGEDQKLGVKCDGTDVAWGGNL